MDSVSDVQKAIDALEKQMAQEDAHLREQQRLWEANETEIKKEEQDAKRKIEEKKIKSKVIEAGIAKIKQEVQERQRKFSEMQAKLQDQLHKMNQKKIA